MRARSRVRGKSAMPTLPSSRTGISRPIILPTSSAQQSELDREQMRKLTDKKLEEFKREQEEKKTGKTSGSFASAIKKAAKQEANRGSKDRGPDRSYER